MPVFFTLSLHDALPISSCGFCLILPFAFNGLSRQMQRSLLSQRFQSSCKAAFMTGCLVFMDDLLVSDTIDRDRKSTRLNSSHANISYAVFCLKKNNKQY